MLDLIGLLESFNRKERFFLINQALGNFQLSDKFRGELGEAISLTIPSDALTAMDYHLDWLTAALHAHERGNVDEVFHNRHQRVIEGGNLDTDLLVAFKDDRGYHIVLLEAKGATGWTNDQMGSKADRLKRIFGNEGNRYPGVVPHYCLASPRPPQQLKAGEWPPWMRKYDGSYFWLELDFPRERNTVTRCDADGKSSKQGQHFRIKRVRNSSA